MKYVYVNHRQQHKLIEKKKKQNKKPNKTGTYDRSAQWASKALALNYWILATTKPDS